MMLNTLYNWEIIEDKYNYVAIDDDGGIYAYSDEPTMHPGMRIWCCQSERSLLKRLGRLNSAIRFYDWRLTLETRPEFLVYTPQRPITHRIIEGEPEW